MTKGDFSFMENMIETISIERAKKVDSLILGEITQIAVENDIHTRIVLNEKKIVEALRKQIPEKPIEDGYYGEPFVCPNCGSNVVNEADNDYKFSYCYHCGQALDWDAVKEDEDD